MSATEAPEATPSNQASDARAQARRGFATVQLTMLSIVVALILENLLATLFGLEHWNALVLLQGLDVLSSSFSMWVGFGLALTLVNKQPSYSDFVNPFLMLIFLSLAVRCITTGSITGFFLAGALATASSTVNLWGEIRTAKKLGHKGPTTIFKLLLLNAAVEMTAASVFGLGWGNHTIACGFLLAAIALQAYASAHSIRIWRTVTV